MSPSSSILIGRWVKSDNGGGSKRSPGVNWRRSYWKKVLNMYGEGFHCLFTIGHFGSRDRTSMMLQVNDIKNYSCIQDLAHQVRQYM